MNSKVEEFIAKANEEKAAGAAAERRRILLEADIADIKIENYKKDEMDYEMQKRAFFGYPGPDNEKITYDQEKDVYVKTIKTPIEVTDEEYEAVAAIVREKERDTKSKKVAINDSAEGALKVIATITLVLGTIGAVISFAALCFIKVPSMYGGAKTEFSFAGLLVTMAILVGSIVTWALLKVFADISITLKKIDAKTK